MTERKLASIRLISEIKEHTNADSLELAIVDGWQVVVRKGEFKANQLVVYFEIDSWVPETVAPFLSKGRVFEGVAGERLRTIRLRGELSQGLVLPLEPTCAHIDSLLFEGLDVTYPLGVIKWEKPLPASLSGQVKGNFPSFLRKTDQERVQNIWGKTKLLIDESFEVSYKLDGSSMTIYRTEDGYGVCSRNLDLKLDDKGSAFVQMFDKLMEDKYVNIPVGYAIQGELIGEGIQNNFEGIVGKAFYVFSVFDIVKQEYLPPAHARDFCHGCGLLPVPIIWEALTIHNNTLEDLLNMAEGGSAFNGKYREGLVFKSNQRDFSFKAISNSYLLNEK